MEQTDEIWGKIWALEIEIKTEKSIKNYNQYNHSQPHTFKNIFDGIWSIEPHRRKKGTVPHYTKLSFSFHKDIKKFQS